MDLQEKKMLRRRAAIAAMQGLLSGEIELEERQLKGKTYNQWIASESVGYAQSLIEEIEKVEAHDAP